MTTEPVLSYNAPPSMAKQFVQTYIWSLILIFFPTVIFACIFFFVVPKFREIFKDFRTSLPLMTQWLLEVSGIIVEYWFATIPLLLLLIVAVPILPALYVSAAPGEASLRKRRRQVRAVILLMSILLLGIVVVALMLPLVKLIQSVSGGGGAGGP